MAHDEGYHPRLVVTEPSELAGTVLAFDQSQLVIGHSDTADLVLEDRFVSRRHALVTVDSAGQVTIRDLNSLGGTFVNDERLAGPRVFQPETSCGSPISRPGSNPLTARGGGHARHAGRLSRPGGPGLLTAREPWPPEAPIRSPGRCSALPSRDRRPDGATRR